MPIVAILLTLFLGDFVWWWRADRILRRLSVNQSQEGDGTERGDVKSAPPRWRQANAWRMALGIFMSAQASGILLIFLDRSLDLNFPFSSTWLTFTYIWHCLLLFPMLLLWIPYSVAKGIVTAVRRVLRLGTERRKAEVSNEGTGTAQLNRREFAQLFATAVPALATVASAAVALWQMQRFRIRRLEVTLSQLPPALDGLTIAHVTDIHVGPFTHGDILGRIIDATNALEADLVLYTGDLINFALSDLDTGLDIARRLRGRHGVFLCEGNHDLFANAGEFRRRTRAAGLRLLVNETETVSIRGTPVQLLGLRWGARDADPHSLASRGDRAIALSMSELLPNLQPGAFPILLAHHPHAFDYAENIPLTLAGHTHGGQLMVTRNLGFGSMLYRDRSGLYRHPKDDRALVVSNGTGNWFPLRTRAPAEIIQITLRRG